MKEKLIYILSFALVFALVTGALIYLNSRYQNIFAFNFTPASANNLPEVAKVVPDSTSVPKQKEPPAPVDSVKSKNQIAKTDSVTAAPKDTVANTKKSSATAEIKKVEPKTEALQEPQAESPKAVVSREFQKTLRDSAYQSWIKKTVKLYEEMDAKKAAKVILGYSDNIARDIIFSMKKRKAAEILTEFKPEVATRIIKFN